MLVRANLDLAEHCRIPEKRSVAVSATGHHLSPMRVFFVLEVDSVTAKSSATHGKGKLDDSSRSGDVKGECCSVKHTDAVACTRDGDAPWPSSYPVSATHAHPVPAGMIIYLGGAEILKTRSLCTRDCSFTICSFDRKYSMGKWCELSQAKRKRHTVWQSDELMRLT